MHSNRVRTLMSFNLKSVSFALAIHLPNTASAQSATQLQHPNTNISTQNSNNSKKVNVAYHITVESEKAPIKTIRNTLIKLQAKKAGTVELGAIFEGKPYYHFYMPTKHLNELWKTLAPGSRFTIKRVYTTKNSPTEHAQIILWLVRSKPRYDKYRLLHTSRTYVAKDMSKPLEPFVVDAKLSAEQFSEVLLDKINQGPVQLQDSVLPTETKFLNFRLSTVANRQPFTPYPEHATDLEINVAPNASVTLDEFKAWLKVTFAKIKWQEINHTHDLFFKTRLDRAQLKELFVKLALVSPYSVHSHRQSLKDSASFRIEVRFPKDDPVSLSLINTLSDPETVQLRLSDVSGMNTLQGPRPYFYIHKKEQYAHALGSFVATESDTILIGELTALAWFDNYGMKFNYILGDANTQIDRFAMLGASLNYRFLKSTTKYGPEAFSGIHYKKVRANGPTGEILGLGGAYINSLWRPLDKTLNTISWLRYPKTIELGIEYYPTGATSKNRNVTAYASSLLGRLHVSDSLSVVGGLNYHNVELTNPDDRLVTSHLVFAEIGLGYNF